MSIEDILGLNEIRESAGSEVRILSGGWRGIPCKGSTRSPSEYPYSYDGFYVWYKDESYVNMSKKKVKELVDSHRFCTIWSDHIRNKYDAKELDRYYALQKKHFGKEGRGDYFWRGDGILDFEKRINTFLTVLLQRKVRVVAIIEECNRANGYPYWRIEIVEKDLDE